MSAPDIPAPPKTPGADDNLVTLERRGDVATVTLNRPTRHNALTPELLERLNVLLHSIDSASLTALVLAGAGPTFSSGGDVAGFAAQKSDGLKSYAYRTVSALNDAILMLLRFPAPVIARVQGFVTGGSTGFVLASDFSVIAEDAFIAPYYSEVGFAPDGGWTALLPERIGAMGAGALQYLNDRLTAQEALRRGVVSHVAQPADLDTEVASLLTALRAKSQATIRRTKVLINDKQRLSLIEARLNAERDAFVELIANADTKTRMTTFLSHERG